MYDIMYTWQNMLDTSPPQGCSCINLSGTVGLVVVVVGGEGLNINEV